MKNKNSIKIYYLSIIFLVFISCQKLDEKPLSFAGPDNYYNSIEQAETVLIGHMNLMFDSWGTNDYSWAWRLFRDDDQISYGNLNLDYNHGRELWTCHYAGILNINTLLRAIKNGSIKNASKEQIDELIGQAKLMRAFDYFALVRLFGDVPLYTEEMEDPAINPLPRTPIAEVYELIISDLTDATNKLPLKWPSIKIGRPTRGAAKGLLAKAYLTMATAPLNQKSNYAKARDAAKSCIEDGIHGLVPNIFDVFKLENKYSQEMMWSFNANNVDESTHSQMFTPGEIDGWNNFGVEPRMDTLWAEQPRKKAYILTDIYVVRLQNGVTKKMAFVPQGSTPIDTIHYDKWSSMVPAFGKFVPPNVTQEDYDSWTTIYNVPILRYADVLLIFAEADNMTNGSPTKVACDALNMVIDRANGNTTGLPGHPRAQLSWTVKQFDDAVIQERNWELCFEFDRWFDICRKRILDSDLVTPIYRRQNFTPDDYLWPIPEIDLRLNPLLTQNPGYPSPSSN